MTPIEITVSLLTRLVAYPPSESAFPVCSLPTAGLYLGGACLNCLHVQNLDCKAGQSKERWNSC